MTIEKLFAPIFQMLPASHATLKMKQYNEQVQINAVLYEYTSSLKWRQRSESHIKRRLGEAVSDLGLHSSQKHINVNAAVIWIKALTSHDHSYLLK